MKVSVAARRNGLRAWNYLRVLLCVVFVLFLSGVVRGQENRQQPQTMSYENHNPVEYRGFGLRSVEGEIQDEQGVPIPNASLGLFTEIGHKLVGVVQSSSNGAFKFANVKSGRYRLVAKYDPFCVANVPITVTRLAWPGRRVYVYMRPRSYDSCSYGQMQKKTSR